MLDLARTSAAPDGASPTPPSAGRSHADRPAGGHGADRSFADTLAWLSGAIHGRTGAQAPDVAAADAQTDDSSPSTPPASGSPQDAVQSGIGPDWTAGLHLGPHGRGARTGTSASSADAADDAKDTGDAASVTAAIVAVPATTPAVPLPDVEAIARAAASSEAVIDANVTKDAAKGGHDAGTSAATAQGSRASQHGGRHHAAGAHRAAPAADVADLVTTADADAQADGQIVSDFAEAAGAGVGANAGATGRTPNAQQRETPASSSVKAGGPMANTAADTRRGADLGASPATRRIAAAAAQNVAANSPTPAIGASSDETTPRAVARGAAQTPPPAQATNSDRSNGRDRTAGNQREAGDRAGHPGSSSVTTLTDAAIRSASQNAGTNGRDSQSGPGPFNAPAPATPPSAVAAPSAATVMFGVDGGSLAPGSGPALAAPQATSVDSTMWSSTETLPDSTVNQIVQAIRLQWANGTGEARITLEPEQFGDVTVSVRVERGQVSARVEADAPVVREWLQSNQQTLRHNLAEQNLKLDRLEVAAPPASRDTDRRDGGRQRGDQPPPRRQRQPQGQETFEVVA